MEGYVSQPEPEGETGITETQAILMLIRTIGLASRVALGDGIPAYAIAQILHDEADAINGGDVAEDMSPIKFHMN